MQTYMADADGNTFLVLRLEPDESQQAAKELLRDLVKSSSWDFDTAIVSVMYEGFEVIVTVLEQNGSTAYCCGNGLRAIAELRHAERKPLAIQFGTRFVKARRAQNGRYVVPMGIPGVQKLSKFLMKRELSMPILPAEVDLDPNTLNVYWIQDEPHLVLLRDPHQKILGTVGPLFMPHLNVTIAGVECDHVVSALTFERGVQRMVASSGTGACAAVAACLLQNPCYNHILLSRPKKVVTVGMYEHFFQVHYQLNGAPSLLHDEQLSCSLELEGSVSVRPYRQCQQRSVV